MKAIISTLLAAIIVVNNWVGIPINTNQKLASPQNDIQDTTSRNSDVPLSDYSSTLPDLESIPEPISCPQSTEKSYYLGPVIPQILTIDAPAKSFSGDSYYGGTKGILSTDFVVGAIFRYFVSPDYNGSSYGDVYGFRSNYEITQDSQQLFKLNMSDTFGYMNKPDEDLYCSSTTNPLEPLSQSYTICAQVCPACSRWPVADPGGAICNPGTDHSCLLGGKEIKAGWGMVVLTGHPELSSGIYDIQLIYYGVPKKLPPRSKLSDNDSKNGDSDSRECDLTRCGNAMTSAGDPIDVLTGNFSYSYTDLSLETIAGPLTLQRSYASQGIDTAVFPTDISPGWTHNQDTRLLFDGNIVWFKAHTLNQYRFDVIGDHVYAPYNGVLADLVYENGGYVITTDNRTVYRFDGDGRLLSWTNERGYGFDYSYNSGRLYRVTEPVSGRFIQFNYLGGNLVTVLDNAGRQVNYAYDQNGDLSTVTDSRQQDWGYEYDPLQAHRIITVLAPPSASEVVLRIAYDDQGRAFEQLDGSGRNIAHIDFNPDGSSTSYNVTGTSETTTPDCRGVPSRQVISDVNGMPVTYVDKAYDHNFNLTAMRGADDTETTSFLWSPDGANLLSMTDQEGNSSNFTYNPQNQLIRVDAPENRWITYNYNGPLLTDSTENSSQGDIVTQFTYTTAADAPQPINLLKTVTDGLGHTTHFTYDPIGQLTDVTDALQNNTHYDYDAIGQVESITDALGRIKTLAYDNSGAVTKVIENFDEDRLQNDLDQYNLTTTYEYDEQGRFKAVIDTYNSYPYRVWYNSSGQIQLEWDITGNPTVYTYNDNNTLDNVVVAPDHQTSYEYDDSARVKEVHDALGHLVASYTYNPDDTVHTVTDGAGLVTTYTYDDLHRVIRVSDNAGHVSSTSYDDYGDVLSVTDPLGRVTQYEYSDPGRLTAVTENFLANPPTGYDPNATNVRTEYGYDLLGHLNLVRDALSHETTYEYYEDYRLRKVIDPLQHTTEYTYDALGNLKTLTRPDQTVTTFGYDLVNRLKSIDYPGGTDPDVGFLYNALGRLVRMEDALGVTTWGYNSYGDPTTITDPYNRTITSSYDPFGNRLSINYNGLRTMNYQYNADDLMTTVYDGSNLIVDYSYDDLDRLHQSTYANGIQSTYGYDLSSQLTGITHQYLGRDLARYDYQYDLNGDLRHSTETQNDPYLRFLPIITNDAEADGGLFRLDSFDLQPDSLEESYPAPEVKVPEPWESILAFFDETFGSKPVSAMDLGSNRMIDYTYDALERLKTATYSSGESFSYLYDKVGNRTSQTLNGMTTVYGHDAANRLTSVNGITQTWDDNGNLRNDGVNSYSYDPAGRMTGMNTPVSNFSFTYDGLGNRYGQTVNGEETRYLLDLAAGLTTVLGDGQTTYLYGLGLIAEQKGNRLGMVLSDRLGSVRQLVSQDYPGGLLPASFSSFAYDPFGYPLSGSGAESTTFGYTGEQTDASGLVYLRARYYDPVVGRFISQDPFPGLISDPGTFNAYSYVKNNPLKYTDPSGQVAPLIALGIAILGGAAVGATVSMISQCVNYGSIQTCMKCMDWKAVGAAAGAGALASALAFGLTSLIMPIASTFGLGIGMLAYGVINAIAGQAYIASELSLLGRQSQIPDELGHTHDLLLDGILGAALHSIGTKLSGLSARWANNIKIERTKLVLKIIAKISNWKAGEGSDRFAGTLKHNIYRWIIKSTRIPEILTEVSYLDGVPSLWGTSKTIRVDTVLGTVNEPIAIFELKTGFAGLTGGRIYYIRMNLPSGFRGIPIIEIRP